MSFRRIFPYLATFLVLLGVGAVFVLRPTPFIGLTPEAMSSSLDDAFGRGASRCEQVGDGEWRCRSTAGPGFDVEINGFGCWTAVPVDAKPELATPPDLSGCVTLSDH